MKANKKHSWEKLSSSQARCTICGILKTHRMEAKIGKNLVTYQDNNSVVHHEYVPCIDKLDTSEFYI